MLTSTIPSAIGGQLIAEDVSIAPPCRCGSDDTLNWLSVIDSASKQNDNDSIQLKSLATAPHQVVDLTLPCGRFYLSDLKGLGEVHLHVTGRTALFVAGNVANLGGLQVDLAPDAELDWFVGGTFDFGGGGQVGDASRPAALRIYVAGAASLILNPQNVAANLYAPLSDVVFLGGSDFSGSVFGHTVSNVADVVVHYDAAVQRVGDACPLELPQSCSGCGECQAGQACVAGACTACRNDSDCCSPLVCSAGRCAAFLE